MFLCIRNLIGILKKEEEEEKEISLAAELPLSTPLPQAGRDMIIPSG